MIRSETLLQVSLEMLQCTNLIQDLLSWRDMGQIMFNCSEICCRVYEKKILCPLTASMVISWPRLWENTASFTNISAKHIKIIKVLGEGVDTVFVRGGDSVETQAAVPYHHLSQTVFVSLWQICVFNFIFYMYDVAQDLLCSRRAAKLINGYF